MNMIFDTFSSLVRFATVLAGNFHSNVILSMLFHMVFFSGYLPTCCTLVCSIRQPFYQFFNFVIPQLLIHCYAHPVGQLSSAVICHLFWQQQFQDFCQRFFVGCEWLSSWSLSIAPSCHEEFGRVVVRSSHYSSQKFALSHRNQTSDIKDVVEHLPCFLVFQLVLSDLRHWDFHDSAN